MDKFINTSNGGIPLVNNDFRWSDNSIRDYIDGQLTDFAVTIGSNGNFYLSGVSITLGGVYTVTEGYVYINGEIVKVDAGTYSLLLAPEEYRFVIVETYDTTGAKTTRSGSSINTYRKRRAVPTVYDNGDAWTDDMLKFSLNANQERLQDKIAYKMLSVMSKSSNQNQWIRPTLNTNFSHISGNEFEYRLNLLGQLEVKGGFTTTAGSNVAVTLPANYRPSVIRYLNYSKAGTSAICLLDNNGNLYSPALTGGFTTFDENIFNTIVHLD